MNIFAKSGLMTAGLIAALASACLAGEPGTALKGDALRTEPFSDAKTVATLTRNDKVDIQKRQGGWLYVSSPKGKGWVRMLSIKRGAAAQAGAGREASGLLDVASGRAGTGKVVATTGIRGLNEEQLKSARFNEEELKKAESYAASKQDAERFAKKGKLVRQDVSHQDAPDEETGIALLGGMSVEEEVLTGRQVAGNLLGAAPLVKDDRLQKYLNNVGRWVAMQSNRPDLEWHFGVIDSTDINAFAAPGGYIMVTKGLYQSLGSEAELAGVLAHETGHVIRKHHLKLMQQGRLLEMGSRLLSQKVGSKDEAIEKLIGSGAEVFARGLDKDAEYEADRIAAVLATRAGYDSWGLPAVLQQIGHAGTDDSRVGLLFKTHPHPDDRLTHLGEAMGTAFDRYKGKTVAERFYRIR